MAEKEKKEPTLADSVQESLIGANPGAGEVADVTEHVVLSTLIEPLRAGSAEGTADPIALAGAGIVGALKKGIGPMWHLARGAVAGLVQAAVATNVDPKDAIRRMVTTLVAEAVKIDADFGAAAKGAFQGAIQGAEARGLDPEDLARVAAAAALATEGLRPSAVRKLREVLGDRVDGVPTGIA